MPSVGRQVRDSLKNCLASVLGPEYNELKFLDDLSKNSFTRKTERYGVRPGETPENNPTEVTRSLDYVQT